MSLEIVLFFNPFTRLLSRQIQKERENCCDDRCCNHQYNAAMYADALVRIAYLQTTGGFADECRISAKDGELLQRVKRMVQPGEQHFSYKHHAAALALITALLLTVAWLQPSAHTYHQQQTAC